MPPAAVWRASLGVLIATAFLLALGSSAAAVAPATAQAGRTLTITPPWGPTGTPFVITGSGFQPGERLVAGCCSGQWSQPPDPGVIGNPAGVRAAQADAQGRFRTSFDSSGYASGWYFMFADNGLPTAGNQPAITQFFIWGPALAGKPTLTVTPASGSAGTIFVVTGRGFVPAEGAGLRVLDQVGNFVGAGAAGEGWARVAADGRYTNTFDSSGYAPGQYLPLVMTANRAVVSDSPFTVTSAAPPTMPRTGEGGLAPSGAWSWALRAGLGIVSGLLAGAVARRRLSA